MTTNGFTKKSFGKRREPHRVYIKKGDQVRSFTVSPLLTIAVAVVGFVFSLGYIGATGYLFLRDDSLSGQNKEIEATVAVYERKISALTAQLDRVTSRRMVERQSYDDLVTEIVERQTFLGRKHDQVALILAKAEESGIIIATSNPMPEAKPANITRTRVGDEADTTGVGGEPHILEQPAKSLELRGRTLFDEQAALGLGESLTGDPFSLLSHKLGDMDKELTAALDAITISAKRDTNKIRSAAASIGFDLDTLSKTRSSQGGPFVPLASNTSFGLRLTRAEEAVDQLAEAKALARLLPIATPLYSGKITSRFGPRVDPFLGRPAMHTGIDFKARYGASVIATGPGKVTYSGWKGGYGKTVEIEHKGGVRTRYAHLSRIHVKKGATVKTGAVIGKVGSTGRSTGPHLHYETRLNGKPTNPNKFIRAGAKLKKLLKN